MQQMNDLGYLNNVNLSDIRGGSTGQRLMGTLGATAQGASAGAKVGGGVGGIIGGAAGIVGWYWGLGSRRCKSKKTSWFFKQSNSTSKSKKRFIF